LEQDGSTAKHFSAGYEWENDPNSRSGNVSIESVTYKCRRYISDSGEEGRIHIRIVELCKGERYKIEQGYLIDGEDEDDASAALAHIERSLRRVNPPKGKRKKAPAAPEAAPAPSAVTRPKRAKRAAA
jgi:hypothetical protein